MKKLNEINTIINDCKANKNGAYEFLYKKHYRVLYGIALRYCRTTFEAEDVLQESFIKIFHNIHTYKHEGSFEGWLKRIVQLTAINHYKSNIKYNLNSDFTIDEYKLQDESFEMLFDTLETKEILIILNSMPEGYKIIINLFCIDGYTHKEIAETLNISVGTSKSQLFKAKAYLKRTIETQLKTQIYA